MKKCIQDVVELWAFNKFQDRMTVQRGGEGSYVISAEGQCEIGEIACVIEWSETAARLAMSLYALQELPPANWEAAVDVVSRANLGLAIGNLEVVGGKGRSLRFWSVLQGGKKEPSNEVIEETFSAAVEALEKYYPAVIEACISGAAFQAPCKCDGECIPETDNASVSDISDSQNADIQTTAQVLAKWGGEIGRLNAAGPDADVREWTLAGQGAVVIHNNLERAEAMLGQAAKSADYKFIPIKADKVLSLPVNTLGYFRTLAPAMFLP